MAKSKKEISPVIEHDHYCIGCGETKTSRYFYTSKSPKYDNDKFHKKPPYCKECIKDKVYQKATGLPDKQEFKNCLRDIFDMPFFNDLYLSVLDSKNELIGEYLKQLNLGQYRGMTWKNGETDEEYISKTNIDNLKINTIITDEDLKIEKDVIRLLGYDPFDGYDKFDKKYLNGELLPYLDEQTLEDQFKVSVIIQIVNSNNQIRKIDLVINQLSSDMTSLISNSNDVKSLTQIKSQLNTSNDKLSKENSIALKHRADKKSGQSTIGAMMKQLRELDFEDAEHDYYDMQKAYGMKQAADISNKSICDILNFDEKDMDDMFKSQRDLIKDLQEEKNELVEKIRVLSTDNFELKQQIENKKAFN